MDQKECCGTCKWHEREINTSDPQWVCCDPESDYYTDWTEYDHCCEEWEER